MYIDKHNVKVIGTKYEQNKTKKNQTLATIESSQGMNIKPFVAMLSEMQDAYDAHDINISITMKQSEY